LDYYRLLKFYLWIHLIVFSKTLVKLQHLFPNEEYLTFCREALMLNTSLIALPIGTRLLGNHDSILLFFPFSLGIAMN